MSSSLLVTYGVLFISSSPSVALTVVLLVPRSHLLVVSVLSAFAWCVAMMFASIAWLCVPPLRAIPEWSIFLAVTFQELMRFALHRVFLLLGRRGNGIQALLRPGERNDILSGVAVGVGYALLASLVNFFTTVVDNFSNNSAVYVPDCPVNFIVASASNALALNLLHICLGVLVWPKYTNRDWAVQALVAYGLHLGVAQSTQIWKSKAGCVADIAIVLGMVFVVILYTIIAARISLRKPVQ